MSGEHPKGPTQGPGGPSNPELGHGVADPARELLSSAPPASGPAGTSSTVARGREASGAAVDRARLSQDDLAGGKRGERERPRRTRPAPGATPHGPGHEPASMLDLSDLPETYGKDEVGILSKDPLWYFVYWEVTEQGEAAAREQLGASGTAARLVLRLFATLAPSPGHGSGRETRELRDVVLPHRHGRKYLEASRPGALLRAAVGLLSPEGYFAPVAHSALVRMPPQQPSPQTSVEWLHVHPVRSEGLQRERIVAAAPAVPHKERLPPAVALPTPDLTGEPVAPAAQYLTAPAPTNDAGSSAGLPIPGRQPEGLRSGLGSGSGGLG